MQYCFKTLILFFFVVSFSSELFAEAVSSPGEPPFLIFQDDQWVNEQMMQMTIEEKIAQLMMVAVYPNQNDATANAMVEVIKTFKPGGLLIMQGSPVKTADRINRFQEASKVPLLIAIDGEWGIAMRMDSVMAFPYAQTLGAVQDSELLYRMGHAIGQQMKLIGINMNFAPVADINTNPQNPVINFRSFGEEKINVSQKAWWLASGMQDAGVLPVAKHFPGHGDTETDSHHVLPLINHSKERIESVETFPFRYLSEMGISGIMSGHLNVSALDDTGVPSSLSKKIIDGYLRSEIGYKGLIITDA
ncbi:MAG: glycoside hydrolase family 3 protein, partial [Bacteroidales bacterium]|nr:glycoside hydrolase family 3 protein [Bacteroidales bacterium]